MRGLGCSLVYLFVAIRELASIKIGRSRRIYVGGIEEFIVGRIEHEVRVAGGKVIIPKIARIYFY